jgi:antitoxin ParD1/3/4
MHVSLTPKLEELVRRKVKSGYYNNASEVIREALRMMADRERDEKRKLADLRRALREGERSGWVEDFSMDKLIDELDAEAGAESVKA